MFGPPPEVDPKRRPKNPAGEGQIGLARLLLFLGLMAVLVYYLGSTMTAGFQDQSPPPTPADYKPPQPQPARALDDGLGTLVIYPPTMTYRPEEIITGMKKAKDDWKRQHPERFVVAVTNPTMGPLDYGYAWIIFYESR